MCLSKNLRYLRLKNGYSQDDIANRFGYKSYTTIQKWESGDAEPSVAKLRELANMYKVSMNELLTIDIEQNNQTPDMAYLEDKPNIRNILEKLPNKAILKMYDKTKDLTEEEVDQIMQIIETFEKRKKK